MDIAIGTLALVVFVAVAVVPSRGRWAPPRALRVAAILWLVGWLPVSHLLVPLQMVFVADRYVLVPTLGLALAIAIGLARIPIGWARWALIATVVIASSLRTLEARSSWRDGEALWSNAVSINPDDGGAWSMYAENIKDSDRAMAVVEEGLRHSQSPRLLQRQALILIEQGRRAEGVEMMRRAAEAGEYKAMSNLALLLEEDQQRDEALVWARRAIKLAPSYAAGQRDFGKIVLAAGKPAEALPAFQRAYALEPKSLTNRFNLALALLALGRRAEARPHLEACLGDAKLGPRALELLGR
jgi:tetratricopeptide (TPR) repeat protein